METLDKEVVCVKDRALSHGVDRQVSVIIHIKGEGNLAFVQNFDLGTDLAVHSVLFVVNYFAFVGVLNDHVEGQMVQNVFLDVLQIINLSEAADQEDAKLVRVLVHHVPDEELFEDVVVREQLQEFFVLDVGTLAVLLGFYRGRASAPENDRNFAEDIALLQVLARGFVSF